MFQDSRLQPWKRVIDNVALGLPKEQRGAASEVLNRVGLGDRGGDWPARLSGGQRWRAPWCTTRACCCWTSRWARSTP
jgi:sulfonate transport system ATP-binding protein